MAVELDEGAALLALGALQAIRRALPESAATSTVSLSSGPPPVVASTVFARYVAELGSEDATGAFVEALRFGISFTSQGAQAALAGGGLDDEWKSGGRPSSALLPRALVAYEQGGSGASQAAGELPPAA